MGEGLSDALWPRPCRVRHAGPHHQEERQVVQSAGVRVSEGQPQDGILISHLYWRPSSLEALVMSCAGCRDGEGFELPFSMAFQPIVDVSRGIVFAYEALVRGINGEGAGSVLSAVNEANRYAFDQSCRQKAIELASRLRGDQDASLSINFMPNAVY